MGVEPDIGQYHWFHSRVLRSTNLPALSFEGRTWTYAQLLEDVDRCAEVLARQGVQPGMRVAFLALNDPRFFIAMFAAAKLGAIFVPLNFRLTAYELEFIINDAQPQVLIAGPDHRAVIDSVREHLTAPVFLTYGADAGEGAVSPWLSLDDLMRQARAGRSPADVRGGDDALIMYTSGTTGRPKGAVLTHGNLWWNNVNALLTIDMRNDDVQLTCAPIFHIGGLNVGTLVCWMKGGHVLLHRSFDPGLVLRDVPKYGVTTSFVVPAMLLFLSQHADFAEADLSTLRSLIVGGAPVPEPLLKLFAQRHIPVHQGYGLTETAPMVTFLDPAYSAEKLGSAGRAPLLTDFRLVAPDGRTVHEPHERGEILVRGPNVMRGYWRRDDATRDAISADGWFRTGDVGYVDEGGFLYICDRVKDMIISGGENIYPAEVESVLFAHPAVAEAAVIGRADPLWGESVVAFIALKPGHDLKFEELQQFASERLARYKLPREMHLIDALPRNPTGKVLKYVLRERLLSA